MAGSALLPVVLLMFLLSALALGASVVVRTELAIADRFEQSARALHAAEAALEVALTDLRAMASWVPAVTGGSRSAFSQGAFAGSRPVPGGGSVSLCCDAGSLAGRLEAETSLSSVPARAQIRWRPFLWAPFDALVPQQPPSRLFVVAFIGEDEDEAGLEGSTDANETVVVRAEAVDPGGLRRSVEAVIARLPPSGPPGAPGGAGGGAPPRPIGVLSWREVR